MAMNLGRTHMELVTFVSRFWELLSDPSLYITSFLPVNDNAVYVGTQPHKDAPITHGSSNVVVGSFVTAQARIKLYSYLKKLGKRVLYCDTDSVIYTTSNDEADIECGDYLGDMTSELSEYGPRASITLFCSAGPKSYGYNVHCPDTLRDWIILKVKGITLHYRATRVITLDALCKMVLGEGPVSYEVVEPRKITRLPDHTIVSAETKKSFSVVFTKRHRQPDSPCTTPFGYRLTADEHP